MPQPRLRHRFQQDRIGLTRSVHRLVGEGEDLAFEFEEKGAAAQHILAAVYAAGQLPLTARARVMDTIRKGMRWAGPLDHVFITHLSGPRPRAGLVHRRVPRPGAVGPRRARPRPTGTTAAVPDRGDVQRQFRDLLRVAHPDHGGDIDDAAQRIADLTEARRILLAS